MIQGGDSGVDMLRQLRVRKRIGLGGQQNRVAWNGAIDQPFYGSLVMVRHEFPLSPLDKAFFVSNRELASGLFMEALAVYHRTSPAWDALSAQIQGLGIALTSVDTEADLRRLVERLGHPPIVVYSPEGTHEALQVLEWARRHPVRLRVLVLVEKSDFAQYHECMHLGAAAYDEVSAEPKRIAKILRLAGQGGTD